MIMGSNWLWSTWVYLDKTFLVGLAGKLQVLRFGKSCTGELLSLLVAGVILYAQVHKRMLFCLMEIFISKSTNCHVEIQLHSVA